MPRKSKTENVRKICKCSAWKTCAHPWYLDFQRGRVRYRDNLDLLPGRHAADFARAKDEARRAIVAKLEGRDPRAIIPSDDPTLGQMLEQYDAERPQRDRWQIGRINATKVGGRRFSDWRISEITPETLKQFKRSRPLVAGNRDLALLRTAFNWAVL